MGFRAEEFDEPLARAMVHARAWLRSEQDGPVPPTAEIDEILSSLESELPQDGTDAATVVDELARAVEPGLMAMGSGRFFGWVIGGTMPAAMAADWLVSAWDQNAGMRYATPGVVAVEEVAANWILDLLGLPSGSEVGFVTGATMANFTGLAAARQHVLTRQGWDLDRDGLFGAPPVTVIVGEERHATVDLALRYLGLGIPTPVAADEQGRIRPESLVEVLNRTQGPTILALQAGNIHSGAFDPFSECIDLAREHDAWVHVDGAFGLWAAATPALDYLTLGYAQADSWATDAHKTLNTPYDCGIAIVRHPSAVRSALGTNASYLTAAASHSDPHEVTPELSRRARGVPVWAALLSLGRNGVAELVDQLATRARQLADGIATIPGARILNDVVFTQVSVAFESDERTREVTNRLLADGVAWMSGSHWQSHDVLRVSVSNWSTDEADVAASIAAVRRAAS
jgi:glutamate/tyrosine decarboxylase-like PLP-dependent enzyme